MIFGGPTTNHLYGESGNDRLVAGPNGRATLVGGTGRNAILARNGKVDTIYACAARDRVSKDAVDVVKSDC